jgi:Flp pilus assembly protein TadD
VNLGVLYLKEKRSNDAVHQFASAIDLKTKDPVPYYDLAVLFQQAGRGDLALVLYKKVLELKPNDEDTLQNIKILGQAH